MASVYIHHTFTSSLAVSILTCLRDRQGPCVQYWCQLLTTIERALYVEVYLLLLIFCANFEFSVILRY